MDKKPLIKQAEFIEIIAGMVNYLLSSWPPKSGKTTAREMLAERILSDDR